MWFEYLALKHPKASNQDEITTSQHEFTAYCLGIDTGTKWFMIVCGVLALPACLLDVCAVFVYSILYTKHDNLMRNFIREDMKSEPWKQSVEK